jgi:CHAT domain-containing protein
MREKSRLPEIEAEFNAILEKYGAFLRQTLACICPKDLGIHFDDYEIYNLKLNAELVMLSACSAALGKEIKGEGLAGLTWGFMYAGTPRVIASLWNVRDEARAEFRMFALLTR